MDSKITCPNCQHKFSPDEAFSHEIEEKLKQNLRDEFNKKYLDEKRKLEEKIEAQSGKELKLLKEQFEKQKKELDLARDYELELRKKTADLEEREKNLELLAQRTIDEERKKIQEKTESEVMEKFHLKEREQNAVIDSLKKSLEDAQRKANQGSQQLQGEVLELELEEVIRREFPIDLVTEVGKGKFGADILQLVRNNLGQVCGKIIWESKRTKNFEEGWIDKLKGDLREAKADMAILVCTSLPKDIRIFGQKGGIYITGFDSLLPVARVLRESLISLTQMKALSVGKNERIESLYRYITSSEFAQKIESMMETFSSMNNTLEKEKTAMQRIWAQREKEIDRLKTNTLTIHGSLSGLIEEPLGEVASFHFPDIEILIEEKV